jgi:hypothetical protein
MGSANSIGDGLYIFGGFGMQGGSSQNYNPYMAYGQSGLPSYKKSPTDTSKQSSDVMSKQYNQMNPSGYNSLSNNDDRADENYYPLQDAWVLSFFKFSFFY